MTILGMTTRRVVRRTARNATRQTFRNGPIIDAEPEGGWIRRSSLGAFTLACIVICLAVLIAVPVGFVLTLVIWDQVRPDLVASGWWH